MELFLEQLLNGIAIGFIYALITSGLALVYGILRILHVAHSAVYALGAYVGLGVYMLTGSLFIAIPVSMAACSLVGIAIEKFVYFPLLKYPPYVPLIGSIALLIGIEEILRLVAGPYIFAFPAEISLPPVHLGPITLSPILVTVYLVTIAVLAGLWFLSTKTELGLAMRASSQDLQIAGSLGINTSKIVSITFAIGSSTASIAGILVGIYFNQVYPTMGAVPAYKTLALIVVGGLGSVPGAVLASVLLGISETLLIGYAHIPLPRDALAFIAMIAVLMWRPQGLLGRR